jgi:type II secretory pathway predicted ATPase ExeA
MITSKPLAIGRYHVFIDIAQTQEESRQLESLAASVRNICKIATKTGLWVVREEVHDSLVTLVTTLHKPVSLNVEELRLLEIERLKLLGVTP